MPVHGGYMPVHGGIWRFMVVIFRRVEVRTDMGRF